MTNSILTNMSAMTAIANLNATQQNLAQVQNEISTGLKISTASDNAAYYSISTQMKTQTSNLSAVTDSLNLGSSVLSTSTSALSQLTTILTSISNALVSAKQSGTDKNAIGTQIQALQNQLASAIGSASFNGVNLLDGSSTNAQFVSTVTGTGSSTKVNYLSVDTASSNFGTGTGSKFAIGVTADTTVGTTAATVDIYALSSADANALNVSSTTDSQTLSNYISAIGSALSNVTAASESLGASQTNISLQSTFISSLSNSITNGVSSLVDADMNEASTRLSALQTQQQLGVQALSVANQNSQLILKLFQ